jgi:hypothetical protein
MFRFNCQGKPIIDERFQEAINKWAKAKGVDPEHVFTANDWDIPKYDQYRQGKISKLRCKPPLKLVVKGRINTSVFEEAEITE